MHAAAWAIAILSLSVALAVRDLNQEDAAECVDEFPDCERRVSLGLCTAMGLENVHLVRNMLVGCRASCRTSILKDYNEGNLPDLAHGMINVAGGVGNIVVDMFKNVFEICDLAKGFDVRARSIFIQSLITTEMSFGNESGYSHSRRYTQKGFKKAKLPKRIFGDILDYRAMTLKTLKDRAFETETCIPGVHYPCMLPLPNESSDECTYRNQTGIEMMVLPDDLQKALFKALRPEGEKWAGVPLVDTVVYGIRRYLRGAQLFAHIDHIDTHVISCIINVDQKVDKPWPLQIVDFEKKVHNVLLKPREILWYESTKLPHGRPIPFEGDYFDNIFVHFRPKTDEDKTKEESSSSQRLNIKI